jgi:hypothetical protein
MLGDPNKLWDFDIQDPISAKSNSPLLMSHRLNGSTGPL